MDESKRLLRTASLCFHSVLAELRRREMDRGDVGARIMLHMERDDGEMETILSLNVGAPSARPGREQEINRNALEKGTRLHGHPAHVSAWQSRDTEAKSYGGAIRITINSVPAILSMSGLIEHGDETVLLLIAQRLGWEVDAKSVVKASNNWLAAELLGGV